MIAYRPPPRRRRLGAITILIIGTALGACSADSEAPRQSPLEQAAAQYSQGDRQAAIITLKNLLQQEPNNADERLQLGKYLLEQRDFNGAKKELNRALQSGAPRKDVAVSLALAYMGLGEYKDLLTHIEITDVPPSSTDWVRLSLLFGRAEANLGNPQAAENYLKAALDRSPGDVEILVALAKLNYSQKRWPQTRGYLNAALRADPNYPPALLLAGRLAS